MSKLKNGLTQPSVMGQQVSLFSSFLKPGSHIPPMYLRHSHWYYLGYFSDYWERLPLATTATAELYCRHACEVELESTSQACLRKRLEWSMLPATSVLISEQYQRPCRGCIGGIWEPGLTEQLECWNCNLVERLEHWNCNLEAPSSVPTPTASWICFQSSPGLNSLVSLVNSQLVCLWPPRIS